MEKDLWDYLKSTEKPIVLYGMGNGADKIISVLEQYGIEISGVFASDGFVRDKLFHGKKIESFDSVKERFNNDMIVLLCFGSSRPEVIENVKMISEISELYAPDVPVYGTGIFNNDFYRSNIQRFEWVRDRLSDPRSVQTFDSIIKYKISGKISNLFECEVPDFEPYNSFLFLNKDETFLDLGAYNGDTVKDFTERTKEYSEIIAVEPDNKSFKKLQKNTDDIKNITCINCGMSDKNGKGYFKMGAGRGSFAGKGTETEYITVDSLSENRKITFIKIDVEGEELNTLKGAYKTIKEQRPKMIVSCYHRTEDMLVIPETVLSLRPDYKMYIRHFPSLPAWDTAYYFV